PQCKLIMPFKACSKRLHYDLSGTAPIMLRSRPHASRYGRTKRTHKTIGGFVVGKANKHTD
ncbi:MAG: hypothetical protein ACREP1_07560, partial [Rhodanobacteraceae bacterium]